MEIEKAKIKFANVKNSVQTGAIKGLVVDACACHGGATGGMEVRGALPEIGVGACPLKSQAVDLESLADTGKTIVATVWNVDVSIVAAQKCQRIARVAIRRVAGQLDSQLVITESKAW